jgi:hypothetical protein
MVCQPWYVDATSAGGKSEDLRQFFLWWLQEIGPAYGYHPELTKSILVVQGQIFEAANLGFDSFGFKDTLCCQWLPASHYLRGFIGDPQKQDKWLEEKTSFWTYAIGEIALTTRLYPQSVYMGLQHSLQQEWQYVQRVV